MPKPKHIAWPAITLLFLGSLALAPLERARGTAAAPGSATPSESFYLFRGRAVWLQRSPGGLSVRFTGGARAAGGARALVRELSGSAKLSPTALIRGQSLFEVAVAGEGPAARDKLVSKLEQRPDVTFAYPAWESESGQRLLLTDELVVGRRAPLTRAVREELSGRGIAVSHRIAHSSDEYVLRLLEPKKSDPLALSRDLARSGLVDWAEPNFVQELKKSYVPNDPLFAREWHLRNAGQLGGRPGADVNAAAAWDIEKGNPEITIAVIDDGVETTHPDLAPNIFTNKGEKPDNDIDDDANGYVDDVHGWNFAADSNDANPGEFIFLVGSGDDHGTAVAGVAAARGDNGVGVSGACPRCTILPVKITADGSWATDSEIAGAIRYSALMADVINISWGGTVPTASLQFALQYALVTGRDGKGAVILASSGNDAWGNISGGVAELPAGTYRFRWVYSKNESDNYPIGADTAWLAWMRFPGGELQSFESSSALPPGWTSGGGAPWSVVTDPAHSDEGRGWSHALKAGRISHSQETFVEVVKTTAVKGDVEFLAYVSSEMGEYPTLMGGVLHGPLDGLRLWIDRGNDGTWDWYHDDMFAGVPAGGLMYPAVYPQAIAVGATTDLDSRAYYSQYGSDLDLVAPGGGASEMNAIATTDRSGGVGYDGSDYFEGFAGTSASAPLAAGVAGLILSRNPGLTEPQVRQIMERSADKIRPDLGAYDSNGHSARYGYGRVNAQRALASTPLPSTIQLARQSYKVREGRAATVTVRRGGNVLAQVSVRFATVGGTARGRSDFKVVSRRLTFESGQVIKKISIPIHDDKTHERSEGLSVRLSNPSAGAVASRPSVARLTILDGDFRRGRIGSARLTEAIFGRNQAGKIKLVYRFSRPSGSFGYVLQRRSGASRWKTVRSVRKIGDFKGSRSVTMRALFAGRPIAGGRYRLRLLADTNSRRLDFRVS